MLPADPPQMEERRGVGGTSPVALWPALRSISLLLASLGLVLIGTLSLVGPSNSLSDRALHRACHALDDHLVDVSCSDHLGAQGSVDIDVTVAFLLAVVMAALFLWSMHGYWRMYTRGAVREVSRLFRD